jgi:hypothetical protein
MLAQLAGEALHIEVELLRVADEVGWSERVLVVEQQVVHRPERVLVGGGFGCLGSELGMGMNVVQRQVAPYVADVAELAQELSDERLGLSAVRAFEVAVLDDCDGCFERPADVIAFRIDLDVEIDERLVGAEQGVYPGTPREQRRGSKQEPRNDRRAKGGA